MQTAPKYIPGQKKEQICELLLNGRSYSQIVDVLHCSKSTIAFHAKRLGLWRKDGVRYDWKAIQEYHDAGHNRRECMKKFGFAKATWMLASREGRIKPGGWTIPLIDLLVLGRKKTCRSHLKMRSFKTGHLQNKFCECGISSWRGQTLSFHLEHKNGNKYDNRLENLSLLCPNCHTQTPTYGSRNRGKYLPCSLTGKTSGSGPEDSRFET